MKLGCDPEIFLLDASEGLVASCGLIGGSKDEPLALSELGEGFAVQEDNVAIEFNIPAADTEEEFVSRVASTVETLKQRVATLGLHFSASSAAVFPQEQLKHPLAMEFGCEPDFNAWANGAVNPRPKASNAALRTAGGHIHFGIGEWPGMERACALTQLADLYLAVPSIIMDTQGGMRRDLYGKKGCFRPKPYGLEYRTLSNFWCLSPELSRWAYRASLMTVDAWYNNKNITEDAEIIQRTIDNNDVNAAMQLANKHQLLVI
jgi:hypothetical protein